MNTPNETDDKFNIIDQLMDLIKKMPQGEQQSLLSELEERFSKFKRKHYRKSVRTSVEYSAGDRSDKGFIHDISAGGVFIETRMPFRTKEAITLNFSLDPEKQVRIRGQIARISPDGVGVEFMRFDKEQVKLIISQLDSH